MPAATRLSEIKSFSDAVDHALTLQHAAVGGAPTLPRSDGDNDDLFIIPNFTLAPASSHLFRRPDGHWDHDMFPDCIIEWELSVKRLSSFDHATFAATYTLLSQEVTRILLAMDPMYLGTINANLPYHHLTRLQPRGATQGFNSDRGEDMATVRFSCCLGIKPYAWPPAGEAYTNPTF